MIVFLVFGIQFMVVAIVLFFICANGGEQKDIKPAIALFFYATGILNILIYSNGDTRPSALDVYRGKTVLKITYEDKVPVDTVVIYKKGGEK